MQGFRNLGRLLLFKRFPATCAAAAAIKLIITITPLKGVIGDL